MCAYICVCVCACVCVCVCVYLYISDQIRSVAQSGPTLCNPMNRSTPGLPVHHQLTEFTETHIHRVSAAIQASHPLSSPSPLVLNHSQHQGLFQWVGSFASGDHNIGVSASASVLPMNIQDWSLGLTGLIFLLFKGLSRIFFSNSVQNYQFFGAQPSLWSNSHIPTWPLEKP